jgi:hypothetical protein
VRKEAPRYERRPAPSKLDPFKEEIHRLLGEDAKLPGQRIRELIEPLGYSGSKTILDDYLREVRCLRRRRERSSGPFIAPGRSASSICGSRLSRCRWDIWSGAAAGSSLRAWATRAPAPAR